MSACTVANIAMFFQKSLCFLLFITFIVIPNISDGSVYQESMRTLNGMKNLAMEFVNSFVWVIIRLQDLFEYAAGYFSGLISDDSLVILSFIALGAFIGRRLALTFNFRQRIVTSLLAAKKPKSVLLFITFIVIPNIFDESVFQKNMRTLDGMKNLSVWVIIRLQDLFEYAEGYFPGLFNEDSLVILSFIALGAFIGRRLALIYNFRQRTVTSLLASKKLDSIEKRQKKRVSFAEIPAVHLYENKTRRKQKRSNRNTRNRQRGSVPMLSDSYPMPTYNRFQILLCV